MNTDCFISQLKSNAADVISTQPAKLLAAIAKQYAALNTNTPIASCLPLDLAAVKVPTTQQTASGEEPIGLSQAALGICDTGTLVLTASASNPTRINFLVDHHWVIVHRSQLVPSLTDAMNRLTESGAWECRAVNFISGPSRTADIEQTIQLGAHGPRHLTVFLVLD